MATRNTQKMLKMASGTLTGEEAVLTAVVAAAPAGGTGAAAGAWDTSGNRDTAIAAINNSITSNWLKLVPPEPKSERPQPAMTDEQRAEKVRAERAAFRASKGLPADGEKLFKPTE